MVIAGDVAVEEPKGRVVADMDPEAEAEQGKSRAVGEGKSDDDAEAVKRRPRIHAAPKVAA